MAAQASIARSIIVTGSSSGIGAELCRRIAAPGIGLTIHARHNADGCKSVAAECEAKGAATTVVLGDMSDPATSSALAEQAIEAFGQIDGVVANAGLPVLKGFQEGSAEELDYALRSNLSGFFSLVHAALPHLRKSRMPRVIAVGSLNGHVFRPGFINFPLSGASKAGLVAMMKGVALELAPDGIPVNCVVPGLIDKDEGTGDGINDEQTARMRAHIPMGRTGRAEEVAAVMEFLLSDGASYVTGETIAVGGGIMM